jgi:predicted aspartyl protease
MVRYAYNRQVNPPAPFVHLVVLSPHEGSPGLEVPALLDTGADITVIPGRLVGELSLIPLDSILAVGFGGQTLTLPTYLVELRIRGLKPIKIKVLASYDEHYSLLGRDVLNQFKVTLDGPNLSLQLD